jgi:thiamine kinase-like enzyme
VDFQLEEIASGGPLRRPSLATTDGLLHIMTVREQTMTHIPVEEAIAQIPMWKNATDLKVTLLSGGITNHNYRVDTGGKSFVLRISGDKTELLGINREYEYQTQLIASELGVAPEAIYFHEPKGYLVTRFIEGHEIPPEELRKPENLVRVVEILHHIHALPIIPGTFSAFQVVRDYAKVAKQYKVAFPENFEWLFHQMEDAEAALANLPLIPRPCHNDLLNGNFLATDQKIYILDWEYAGMGDIFFDLANFCNNHELSDQESRYLLDCYFEKLTPRHEAHLHLMKIMSDFREAMWGLVQIGISNIDFDFREYANKHFERLAQNILNPNWEQWLKEVR